MLDIYETLEVKKIKEELIVNACSEIAKMRLGALKMLASVEEVRASLNNVDEMMSLLLRHNNLPIDVSYQLEKLIAIVSKGGILSPNEIYHVAHDIDLASRINTYFSRVERHLYPNLINKAEALINLSPLYERINSVIAEDLSIKSSASKLLFITRKKIASLEIEERKVISSLVNKYQDYLSEPSYTIRNGSFVLPFKSSCKNMISGIIHDVSTSGQTTFIEPSVVVELNNEIYIAKTIEKEEINRLLKELSEDIANNKEGIITNNNIIAELDYIRAKAIYGNKHDCHIAHIVNKKRIAIKGARHPLIEAKRVVSNDFYFDEDKRMIIISGPNAGGKTIALKTLGLMVMMNQMGLALPTLQGAELSYFPRIFADIGDNQSLADNLSTFAAHVSNLSTITHFVGPNDLVLLDELGTGTSPREGECLALAIMDFLLEKKCFALISSHFDLVKEYAYSHDGVTNAMMVFDANKLLPTYILKVGIPGRSYGLEMAKRYHLDERVIYNAKERLNKINKNNINDVIEKLNRTLLENERLNESLNNKIKENNIKENDLKRQSIVLEDKRAHLLEDVEAKKQEMLIEAEAKIAAALKILNKANIKPHELIEAKKKLEEIDNEQFDIDNDDDNDNIINPNDYVYIKDLDTKGKVVSVKNDVVTIMTSDGMMVKVKKNNVKKTDTINETRKVHKTNIDEMLKIKFDVKLELNIIGEHVDDGIARLSKYLDDCRLRRYKCVRIIHGMGSGVLRKAVHEYLKKLDFVEEFSFGGQFDGGTGATVVKLK